MFPISALTTAVLTLLLIGLSLNVSRLRLRHKMSYGHGQHKDLEVAVRTHGNSVEQTLLFLFLLMALESLTPGHLLLMVLATSFVVARILYPIATFSRRLPLRQFAHLTSVAAQLVAALTILSRAAGL
jgi:uncharacterized protein